MTFRNSVKRFGSNVSKYGLGLTLAVSTPLAFATGGPLDDATKTSIDNGIKGATSDALTVGGYILVALASMLALGMIVSFFRRNGA